MIFKAIARQIIIILFTLIIAFSSLAQNHLSGVVKDSVGRPLINATVKLQHKRNNRIISFAFTDKEGKFSIAKSNLPADSLVLHFSLLGYGSVEVDCASIKDGFFPIQMNTKPNPLPDVVVRNSAIFARGDTINYSVKSFAEKQDMVIADVLRKMPGIEVTSNGQVKYQGVPINKYYIEGRDLLDDRYGLANNNIPASAVDQVQVLENHQPIKALDSFSFSNRAAINIKLNNSAKGKIFGRAKLALGIPAPLADIEVVPMNFGKQQFIGSYKFNNEGTDYSVDQTSFNEGTFIDDIRGNTAGSDLLGLSTVPIPAIKKSRYLFNNLHSASLNELVPVSKDFQLRIGMDYANDNQKQQNNVYTNYFFGMDTVSISEKQAIDKRHEQLQSRIAIISNLPNRYLTNELKFKVIKDQGIGTYNASTDSSRQQFNNNFFSVSNSFSLVKVSGKTIYTIGSFTSFSNTPQSLEVEPLSIPLVSTIGNLIPNALQSLKLRTSYNNDYVSLGRKLGNFGFELKVGFWYLDQSYKSDLGDISGNTYKKISDSAIIDSRGEQSSFYQQTAISYSKNRFKLSASFPINFLTQSKMPGNSLIEGTKALIGYSINSIYSISSSIKFNAEILENNLPGSPYSGSEGFILNNYRSLTNNNGIIPLFETQQCNFNLSYRNPVSMLFLSAGLNTNRIVSNATSDQKFINNFSESRMLPISNSSYSKRFFLTSSKYFYKIKTTVLVGASSETRDGVQFKQGISYPVVNNSWNINGKFSTRISLFTVEYFAIYLRQKYQQKVQNSSGTYNSFNESLTFYSNITETVFLKCSSDHYRQPNPFSSNKDYFFSDLSVHIQSKKKKRQFDLVLENIFNNDSYTSLQVYSNVSTFSEYKIRPRQLLARVQFLF